MQVREVDKIILISGAVPGSNGSYVVVRPAIKKPEGSTKKAEAPAKKPEAAVKKPEAVAPVPKEEAAKK